MEMKKMWMNHPEIIPQKHQALQSTALNFQNYRHLAQCLDVKVN